MGAHMAKELGVYNEEEKICTPQGPQRYRMLNNDPRSATTGIVRTPIQVECTPKSAKNTSHIKVLEINHSFKDEMGSMSMTESVDKSGEQDNLEDTSDLKEVSSTETTKVKQYLETDIDKFDSSFNTSWTSSVPPVAQSSSKGLIELSDVRSPTLEITRTPVLVQCTPELFALHARIESMSFCDFEIHNDDPSAVVSDDDMASPRNQSSINNWLVDVDSKACDSVINGSFADSPKTVAKKQKELNAMKKKLFFTPDAKDISKPKARTPLGNLQASQLSESPQKLIRAKQWRNIKEERQRRGIMDTENTPPSLPPLSKVSSAPGKILDCKRTKTLWDDENTMFI